MTRILLLLALVLPVHVGAFDFDDVTVNGPVKPVPSFVGALDEHCVVSILNRIGRVQADGTWRVDNVPTNFGPLRARATCVVDGRTVAGQSDPFVVPENGVVGAGWIFFVDRVPTPTRLEIASSKPTGLDMPGATATLTVTARYSDNGTKDVTLDPTTTYRTSNAAIVTVGAGGIVTAVGSGTALVTVLHEGLTGFIMVDVVLSTMDADGDGIPDDVELVNGLDPHDPVDAHEDLDADGLTNAEELLTYGTGLRDPDSDDDGIKDGEEIAAGTDGFVTNPLAADTDGDGVRDGLEVATGSDPTDPGSYNLAEALSSLSVDPASVLLTVNTVISEASHQLTVTGHLKDGTTLDLTSTSRGTGYLSSEPLVCTIGPPDGRVFAGSDGTCTITASNAGFMTQAMVTVTTFTPTALSFLAMPGFANAVAVSGSFAYVAAGAAGLQIVDVSDRMHPAIVGAFDTPGNANDVRVAGTAAFVADGSGGLRVVDVSAPTAPVALGALATAGDAVDLVVRGNRVVVAEGAAGIQVVDVTDPTAPQLVGTKKTIGAAHGVDVNAGGTLAVVAEGTTGIETLDLANPASPVSLGSVSTGGEARDVALDGTTVYVADFAKSLTVVDVANPASPVLGASTSKETGGLLADLTRVGRFAIGADVYFVNGVPIVDVSVPATPLPRAILNFSGDANGTGIAADGAFVYLTAAVGTLIENGVVGTTQLYVGQYLALNDLAGVPPTVSIVAPLPGPPLLEGCAVPVRVDAVDDVAVQFVGLLVDGATAFTDTSPPYEFLVTPPPGATSITLGATATDLGFNVGTADSVVLTVVADPGTTVTGLVVDGAATPVAGAPVSCNGVDRTTGGDGRFTMPLASTCTNVRCVATFDPGGGTTFRAVAAKPPVRGGTTDVGTLTLKPFGFTVTASSDVMDAVPGDGHCETVVGNGVCTLRAAVQETNALAGEQEIHVPAGTYDLTQIVSCIRKFPGGGTQQSDQVALCLTDAVTIEGAGAATTVIDGKGQHRVLFVSYGAVAEIRGVTLTNGFGEAPGGGVSGGCINNQGTLRLTKSVVSNGTLPPGSAGGAGIYNAASLTLLRSTVTANVAATAGGGGGIFNDGSTGGVSTVIDTIISNNSCTGAVGGGIMNYGGIVMLRGSTIAGNTAPSSQGGGIYCEYYSTLSAANSTISGNQSGSSGGGISNRGVADLSSVTITANTSGTAGAGRGGGVSNAGAITARNTIIAGNSDLASGTPHPDCEAPNVSGFRYPLTSEAHNLIGDTTGCGIVGDTNGNITNQDAGLGPLLDNGGPTPTHALEAGSPAIDAANPALPGSGGRSCPATDQRGVTRPQPAGGHCDMGAFEAVQ